MVRNVTALLIAALLALAVACGSDGDGPGNEDAAGGYANIAVGQLAAMMEAKDFTLVNVHVPYEGEIDGTDLFVPFDEIEARAGELPADRDAKIVLYCMSGNMSEIAAVTLVDLGYTDVSNVEGGMIAWEDAGYPLETRGAKREAVVASQ